MGACVTHSEMVSAAYHRNDWLFQNARPLSMKDATARKMRKAVEEKSYDRRSPSGSVPRAHVARA